MQYMVAEVQDVKWDDIRVLLAVLRGRSLKAAASRLQVNASTVSRRIDALETTLDTALFERTPEGLVPTAAAERLLVHAEDLERAAHEFERAVSGFESQPEGVVRISAPPGVADHFVAHWLVELAQRHPAITIELDASIDYVSLSRRQADIALRGLRPDTGDLVAIKIGSARESLLCSPTYADAIGSLRTFEAARYITWDRGLEHLPAARWIAAHVPADCIVLRTNSINSQVAAAQAGLGVVSLPSIYAGFVGLTALPLGRKLKATINPLPEGHLWMVGHRALRHVPRIAVVWDFLLEKGRALGL